ncbi:MAG TPA: hypothetical protein VMD98_02705 [Bryocella sp.]|nr:hypothetical protein [Bryocella sp.]
MNHRDEDEGKGAVEQDRREQNTNTSLTGQNPQAVVSCRLSVVSGLIAAGNRKLTNDQQKCRNRPRRQPATGNRQPATGN